jgi:hypothetical protein
MARGAYTQTTTRKILRVLIAFAEGEQNNFADLVRGGKAFATGPSLNALGRLTPRQVAALKSDLRAFVRFLAGGSATEHQDGPRIQVELVPAKAGNRVSLFVNGEPRDVVLYQTLTMVEAVGIDRLRLCPAPDCGRAFVKVGRREYCSPRCQRRVFLATYDPFKAQPRRKDHHGKPTRKR